MHSQLDVVENANGANAALQEESISALPADKNKPVLLVRCEDLPTTVRDLADIIANSGNFFVRGVPTKVVVKDGRPIIKVLTRHSVVIEVHALCEPRVRDERGEEYRVTLPSRAASMYLDMQGEWNLPVLNGICTAPLLKSDGTVQMAEGYDSTTGLWCAKFPPIRLSSNPTRDDAQAALLHVRQAFRTFPFADALRRVDDALGVDVVLFDRPPSLDESSFITGLMTAVCRPSLSLCPGLLVRAPQLSGAAAGKGLLARAICSIAFGSEPHAFTDGNSREELDKRLAAQLVSSEPCLLLDNLNNLVVRSNLLAQILTERSCRVRVLGCSRMVDLNTTAFVILTGNDLHLSEDLVRRFLVCNLDPRCEDPEQRQFEPGFLVQIKRQRPEMLASILTIWRWGRQNHLSLDRGRPLGSYEEWCEWVRDPLLSLGCPDPIERLEAIKSEDPIRENVLEIFQAWANAHGERPVKAKELADSVKVVIDSHRRGRNYLNACLGRLVGTRIGGWVLTRQKPAGKWGKSTYALVQSVGELNILPGP
jgi:hypothetical protein